MRKLAKILVPTDFEPGSELAFVGRRGPWHRRCIVVGR
jgi:hypothetical protein